MLVIGGWRSERRSCLYVQSLSVYQSRHQLRVLMRSRHIGVSFNGGKHSILLTNPKGFAKVDEFIVLPSGPVVLTGPLDTSPFLPQSTSTPLRSLPLRSPYCFCIVVFSLISDSVSSSGVSVPSYSPTARFSFWLPSSNVDPSGEHGIRSSKPNASN